MAKVTQEVGAVPDNLLGLFGVHYTRTPKERANGSGQTSVRAMETGRAEIVLAAARFAAYSFVDASEGSGRLP